MVLRPAFLRRLFVIGTFDTPNSRIPSYVVQLMKHYSTLGLPVGKMHLSDKGI